MTRNESLNASVREHLGWLLRLDRQRLLNGFGSPTPGIIVATLIPVLVVVTALWGLGRIGGLSIAGAYGGVTLGMLISGPVAFLAYGILFGGRDDVFLRQIGIHPGALFIHRSIRLVAAGLAIAASLIIPFVAGGEPIAPVAAIGFPVAVFTAGAATFTFARAARSTVGMGDSWMGAGIRQFDPDLAKAGPLVYAPLLPFIGGAALGAAVGAGVGPVWMKVAASIAIAALAVLGGVRAFASAAPRFVPHAREMSYVPPPEGGGESFRVGRGLSALLPRRAAAVWVRDATVAGRRFTWASRVTWPVAIASIAALARWGADPAARAWVIAAVGTALLVQAAAVIGLGAVERRRVRWVDRSAGLRWWERFLGRWAWAWGLSLWLLVPVGLAWAWWSGVGSAWVWPLAGAAAMTVAVAVSLLTSQRTT